MRYDGGHKRRDDLLRDLGPHLEWVPVCPEVEMGMSTPREPIDLRRTSAGLRMIGVTSGRDWTPAMDAFGPPRVASLRALGLSGYIFKSRSPSCNVHGERGLFADAVLRAIPGLPVADDEELRDPGARAGFLARVRHYRG